MTKRVSKSLAGANYIKQLSKDRALQKSQQTLKDRIKADISDFADEEQRRINRKY